LTLLPLPAPHVAAPPNVHPYDCGQTLLSLVTTQNQPVHSSVPNFNTGSRGAVPGRGAGRQTRCLKLLFTAESSCDGYAGDDFCYVRALVDGVPMDRTARTSRRFDSE